MVNELMCHPIERKRLEILEKEIKRWGQGRASNGRGWEKRRKREEYVENKKDGVNVQLQISKYALQYHATCMPITLHCVLRIYSVLWNVIGNTLHCIQFIIHFIVFKK